ncbi:MAG: hypothetical protein IKO36_03100 [Bacteroidaceae bacterium]|nr:hypothetical protein [Bacteroidaceae bacterium]
MSSKNDELNVFNVSIDDLTKDDKPQGNANLYSPSYDKSKDGVYKSKIRFLPNVFNPRETMMRKYVYFLKDLNTDQGFYVDSPSTINEKCIIQDTFFKLRNSSSAADKELSENLKRKEFWYSAVQIIKDKQAPELEGKVMIFRYGYKIKQKIDEQLKPVIEDAEPNNPFDLFDGKVFNLVICKKDGFANYDSSVFANTGSAIVIDGNEMSDDDDDRETIVEYLKENTPDFNEFKFKPWDAELRKKVLKILSQYGSAGADIKKLMKQNDDEDDDIVYSSNTKKSVDFDDILYVHFISIDQTINCGIKCLKTDTFAEVEEKLYQKYEKYRETNNNFITKGKVVLRFKKIFENNINDGDKVELINIQ